MTTLELSREMGIRHSYIIRLLGDALRRHEKEGNQPIDITRGRCANNKRLGAVLYQFTPEAMRTLYAYSPKYSAVWHRIYEAHPEWLPANHAAINNARRREATQRRARCESLRMEREAEVRAACRSAMSEADLVREHLYSFTRAAHILGYPSADKLKSDLQRWRVIELRFGEWELLPPHAERGYAQTVTRLIGTRWGVPTPFPSLVWTERGMAFLLQLIKKKKLKNTTL